LPHPGRRLDLPLASASTQHPSLLLARVQGGGGFASDARGARGRVGGAAWPNCQHPNPHPDPLAGNARHPRSLLVPGTPPRHFHTCSLCALHAELGQGTFMWTTELATPLGSTSPWVPQVGVDRTHFQRRRLVLAVVLAVVCVLLLLSLEVSAGGLRVYDRQHFPFVVVVVRAVVSTIHHTHTLITHTHTLTGRYGRRMPCRARSKQASSHTLPHHTLPEPAPPATASSHTTSHHLTYRRPHPCPRPRPRPRPRYSSFSVTQRGELPPREGGNACPIPPSRYF
jgi:hypothetical protein